MFGRKRMQAQIDELTHQNKALEKRIAEDAHAYSGMEKSYWDMAHMQESTFFENCDLLSEVAKLRKENKRLDAENISLRTAYNTECLMNDKKIELHFKSIDEYDKLKNDYIKVCERYNDLCEEYNKLKNKKK